MMAVENDLKAGLSTMFAVIGTLTLLDHVTSFTERTIMGRIVWLAGLPFVTLFTAIMLALSGVIIVDLAIDAGIEKLKAGIRRSASKAERLYEQTAFKNSD